MPVNQPTKSRVCKMSIPIRHHFLHPLILSIILTAVYAQLQPTDTGRRCKIGTYDNGNVCLVCPRGTISTERNTFQCTSCAPDESTDTRHKKCSKTCRAGRFVNGNRECQSCGYNSYSSEVNSDQCTKCMANEHTYNVESKSKGACETCGPGGVPFFDDYGQDCECCPKGSVSKDEPGIPQKCERCPDGSTTRDTCSSKCIPCRPGTYFEKGGPDDYVLSRCVRCPSQTFVATEGSSKCMPCPKGSMPSPDRSSCIANCLPGSPGCSACPPGSERAKSGGGCTKCASGKVNRFNSLTPCGDCPRHLVGNANSDSCICRNGMVRAPWGTCVKKCPRNTISDGNGSCKCLGRKIFVDNGCNCRPGERKAGDDCVPCNSTEIATSNKCTPCERDMSFDLVKRVCVPCPAGMVQDERALAKNCVPCLATHTTKYGNLICGCPPGTRWSVSKCVKCPAGTALDGSTCKECGKKFFSDEEGLSECKLCPEGQQYSKEAKQRSCPPKCPPMMTYKKKKCVCGSKFINVGTKDKPVCKSCPSGSSPNYAGLKCVCDKCGFVLKGSKCVPCPAGQYTQTVFARDGKCLTCEKNEIPSDDKCGCQTCMEKTYSLIVGATKCVQCKEGEFVTFENKCGKCDPGFRVRNGVCVKCFDGYVNSGGDMAFCIPCKKGTVPSADRRTCV